MVVLHEGGVTDSGIGCGVHRMIICGRGDESGVLERNVNLVHHGLKSATKGDRDKRLKGIAKRWQVVNER
jgi:hypothetical protein